MARKFWSFITDIRLTFWLLLVIAVMMGAGSLISQFNYQLIDRMNDMTVQAWFFTDGIRHIGLSWWLPVLFLCFGLLGANILACTIQRIGALIRMRRMYSSIEGTMDKITSTLRMKKFYSALDFFTLFSPSLIHILFLVMLLGHFATFTMITRQRVHIHEGSVFSIPGAGMTKARVVSIQHDYYPDTSLLKGSIRQTSVTLSLEKKGRPVAKTVAFMRPLFIGGRMVSLEMNKGQMKDRGTGTTAKRIRIFGKKSRTNRQAERVFRLEAERNPEISVVMTRDPGIYILVPSFFMMLLLLIFYYARIGSIRIS